MPKTKIQDEQEVLRWFEEGRSYIWMVEEYERKYNIETTITMWGNFRRRRGLPKRVVRDDNLIPWLVKDEHRWAYPVAMLRTEARRRAGGSLTPLEQSRVDAWKARLEQDNMVVHYEPDSETGFFYVERREGVDLDLIREPPFKTTKQPSKARDA